MSKESEMSANQEFSIIICAYTEKRWDELVTAVRSVKEQSLQPHEIIVVIDHNLTLYERARANLHDVIVVKNKQSRGLSGARNTGIANASGSIIAFMDEDATAASDWLDMLSKGYKYPQVLGVGGAIQSMWLSSRPTWFPEEFDWVVGCTYRGMPEETARVRNLIGCNMSFRREVFEHVGGFRDGIGRIGTLPVGCEETELCIRANQQWPNAHFLYNPQARVHHRVPHNRATWNYFWKRCYSEGVSKALISRYVGSKDSLSNERHYVSHTLPQAIANGIIDTLWRGNLGGFKRVVVVTLGLGFTSLGYIRERTSQLTGQSRNQVTTNNRAI